LGRAVVITIVLRFTDRFALGSSAVAAATPGGVELGARIAAGVGDRGGGGGPPPGVPGGGGGPFLAAPAAGGGGGPAPGGIMIVLRARTTGSPAGGGTEALAFSFSSSISRAYCVRIQPARSLRL
jgi:hypothetical protein